MHFLFHNQTNKLAKKIAVPSSSTLFHLLLLLLILRIFILSVCLRFTAGVSFSLFFWFCLSLGLFFFPFSLLLYSCFDVVVSVFCYWKAVVAHQKKKKKLVKQTKLCQEQIIPIGAVGSSQVAARSFSMACLARGVTLRRESQECY